MEQVKEGKDGRSASGATKKEARIVVNIDSELAIAELTDAVNTGFEAGRATRFDVANFVISWFKSNAPADVVAEIRRQSSDGFTMLDAVQKRYKTEGQLPPDIQAVLDLHFFGEGVKDARRSKKALKTQYIKDTPLEGEAA